MEATAIVASIRLSQPHAERFLRENAPLLCDQINQTISGETPSDMLLVQYFPATETLGFIFWTELRSQAELLATSCFKALQNIVSVKDKPEPDYIAFSTSAPNFATDPLWHAMRVLPGQLEDIEPEHVPQSALDDMATLMDQLIFQPALQHQDKLDMATQPYEVFLDARYLHPILISCLAHS